MFRRIFDENARERVLRYREMAVQAQELAEAASLPRVREAFMRSSHRWLTLAALVEMGDTPPHAEATNLAAWLPPVTPALKAG